MAKEREDLRRALAQSSRPYPARLKEHATEYARARRAQGVGWDRIAGELGVAPVSLRNWAKTASPSAFEQVELGGTIADSVVLVTLVDERAGIRVQGVPIEHVAELVRRLR